MNNTHFDAPGQPGHDGDGIGSVGSAGAVGAPMTGAAPQASPAADDSLSVSVSPLGTIAGIASPPPRSASRSEASVRRFMLQSGARELVPDERVARCLRAPFGSSVKVLYSAAVRAAHYSGLQTCGSIWMCPVCAAKISERRRLELSLALAAHTGWVFMATFTVQHNASDALSTLLAGFLESLRCLRNGAPWLRIEKRYSIVGMIRAVEVTHGKNGWHPHAHILIFTDRIISPVGLASDLKRRWLALLAAAGLSASWAVGVDVAVTDNAVSGYVSKFGAEWTAAHELTKAAVKVGRAGASRTVAELLAAFVVAGDDAAGVLWREYAVHFKGKRQLVWSRGLRARLLPDVDEKTDEEIAKERDQMAVVLASLSLAQWGVVLANDARAELLNVASGGDAEQVYTFLRSLGVEI